LKDLEREDVFHPSAVLGLNQVKDLLEALGDRTPEHLDEKGISAMSDIPASSTSHLALEA
jgi:hypothetical protein